MTPPVARGVGTTPGLMFSRVPNATSPADVSECPWAALSVRSKWWVV